MDVTTTHHRPARRLVAIGVVAAGLCVVGTGVATAAAPTSALSRSVTEILQSAGVDWSSMPDGYTPQQYEAFWGAGYTSEDVEELGALWNLGTTETKARAGQLILDGQPVPVPVPPGPVVDEGAVPVTDEQFAAFWDAGYTSEDVEALGAIWNSDFAETKARAGQMLLDGQTPPVAPSGTPAGQS
ncbi:hypothetical protein [Cellulomonas xylanilytica]|uniref:Uncharacterized protein n=1 Tax=Cellulomonas xylanilytica TaxID=233583 RepID=A0A510V596_9CELL|nr:hypothetical protein [Cellulomonas xylanilytica]GEK21986.1 hypothetical protein CXY01_25060 [Cellulomonas xylanilytica]